MMTTNIDVTDGLTNGAVGTVTNLVIDQTTGKIGGSSDMSYHFTHYLFQAFLDKNCKNINM